VAAVLVLAFVLVPIVEIYVIIQVGQVIGGWPTVALLVAESLIGGWLVRREGRRAWAALRRAFGAGRIPDREIADGALLLIGGTLLLTPGFLTDVAGFFLVLPFTRPIARRLLTRWLGRRASLRVAGTFGAGPSRPGASRFPASGPSSGPVVHGDVVQGEVVDDGGPSPSPPR
jgi:UPF0716 protein FxsA